MKRNLFLILLVIQLAAAVASAQIQVRKSAFTPVDAKVNTFIPTVALNTRTGDSLVIWTGYVPPNGTGILGRFLNAKGIPITKPVILVNDSSTATGNSAVTYNPLTNEFLLAYNKSLNNLQASIMVLRLTPNGRPVGTAINLTNDPATFPFFNEIPNVVFNPKTGGYTVVWYLHGDPAVANDSFPFGVVLTDKATVNGPVTKIVTGLLDKRGYVADIAYLPSGNKLLLLYRVLSEDRTTLDYWLGTLDPMLKNVNPSNFTKINSMPVSCDTGFALWSLLAGLSFPSALSGKVYYPDNSNTKGRTINAEGKLLGASIVAFKPPKGNSALHLPSAAFTMTSKGMRGILIGTEDEDPPGAGSTWAQVLDESGKPIGTPIEINASSATEMILQGGEIIALPGKPTDTVFHFVWFATLYSERGGHFSILKFNLDLTP